ncbi:hypothetical protein B0H10DRAFT_1954712 [Mycena sp. CBHHK59/15]|nr:hypothetical protein B0H10DRAFT_1954712 [Mycena sp. CBHHK59/15]
MPSPNPSPAGEPGVVLAQPDPGKNDMVFKPRQQTIDFISPPWALQEHSGQQQAPTGAFTLCLCCADSSHNCRRGQNVCYVPERVHHHSRDSWSRAPLFAGSRTSGSNPTLLFHDHSDVNMEMPGLYSELLCFSTSKSLMLSPSFTHAAGAIFLQQVHVTLPPLTLVLLIGGRKACMGLRLRINAFIVSMPSSPHWLVCGGCGHYMLLAHGTYSAPDWAQKMPNPVRKIAKGCPVFSLWIFPWSDNVSGNVSKQFNLHMNLYMLNANLPHQKSLQEYFVQFCSASPHASSGEQFKALADDLGPDKYHEAYDCELEQDILFRILPMSFLQTTHSKPSPPQMLPGISRTPAKTVQTIKQQIWAACSGVQEAVDNLQTSTGVKDKTALFWIEKLIVKARETQRQCLAADPCLKDKNLKGDARKAVKTKIKDLIQWELYNWVILQPDDRYARIPKKSSARSNLCAGDHYNILLSVRGASFEFSTLSESHLAPGLDPHQDSPCEILHSILLGDDKYIWHKTNKADLQICINNVLDIWGLIDPAWIVTKYKLYVLPHLPDDIRRFGPSILFQTEVFECWNGIFRLCSILSNHQAPSHDIGVTLADMERFKHQVSRGWWKPTGSQEYVQAGTKVISFLHHNKELQWWLGWMDESKPKPGSIKLESRSKARSGTWHDLLEPYWTQELDIHGSGKTWTTCKKRRQCWQDGSAIFSFLQDILFIFNVQHDCYGSKCPAVEDAESVIQEQSAMRKRQKVILHRDTNIYFINMHALHNADLLRDTLPRNLTAPIPYFPDHDAKHKEFAALLRVSGPAKHATALKKSKETWERNLKVRKGVTAVGVEGDMNEEADSNPDASGEH